MRGDTLWRNVFFKSFKAGRVKLVEHDIDTGKHPPIRQAPYRIPIAKQAEIKKEISDMEKSGAIKRSQSL